MYTKCPLFFFSIRHDYWRVERVAHAGIRPTAGNANQGTRPKLATTLLVYTTTTTTFFFFFRENDGSLHHQQQKCGAVCVWVEVYSVLFWGLRDV